MLESDAPMLTAGVPTCVERLSGAPERTILT